MNKKIDLKDKHQEIVLNIKKKVYFVATILGIIIIFIVWGLSVYLDQSNLFDRIALPFLAILLLFLLVLSRFNRIKFLSFEILTFCLIFIYFFFKIYMSFQVAVTTGDGFGTSDILWVPVLYILGFSLLGKRRGFTTSLVLFLSLLLFSVNFLIQARGIINYFQPINFIAKLFLVSSISIILLYLMTYIGEHHFKSLVTAEVNASMALTDSLTQVDNRRQLEKHIQDEINRSTRYKQQLSIIMMDVDHFKKVNDRYGHSIGDKVLVKLAVLVGDNLRSLDKFGRWGGDEFVCVAVNSNLETSCQLAERLRKVIEETTTSDILRVTVSFGVTVFGEGDTVESLIGRADEGLMQAKSTGRNRVVCVNFGNEPLG